jgi:hypothetical protein
MPLKPLSKYIVIVGTLTIWTIKLLIRPYVQTPEALQYFLGVAPNFIGSFCLLFGTYWLMGNAFFLISIKRLSILYFSLLLLNEYLQLIPIFGRTFDWNDVLFSAIGLLLSCYLIIRAYNKTTALIA